MAECCIPQEVKHAKARSDEIDKQILSSRGSKENRSLLIGIKGSGKTTIIKQRSIIYGKSISDDERKEYKKLIFQNLFEGIQALCRAMKMLDIQYRFENVNEANAKLVMEKYPKEFESLDAMHVAAIESLMNDNGVKQAWERRNEFVVPESAKYFIDNVYRLSDENYLPTLQDILFVKEPGGDCLSVHKYEREYENLSIIDVGGLLNTKHEKWMHCFEGIECVEFVAALTDYDNKDRMEKSIDLFKTVTNSFYFQESEVMLLLNKADLFESKIQRNPLNDYYPEYDGEEGDTSAAKDFMKNLYLKVSSVHTPLAYWICATDTENMNYAAYQNIDDRRLFRMNCRESHYK